jgi:excisionase family DNA binding protein
MSATAFSDLTRLVRVTEVAQQLGLSRSKVYQMMDAGELSYVKFGKSRRVPLDAVERLVRESTIAERPTVPSEGTKRK